MAQRMVVRARAIASVFALGVGALACSSPVSDASGGAADLTSIESTAAKRQSIPNCWLFATAAWTESLHLRVSDEPLDLSEAYWTYFSWFDQLTDGAVTQTRFEGELAVSNWWGISAELMRQRGWMSETDFLPEDRGATYSLRQQRAFDAIRVSLTSGVLSSPVARSSRALVLRELNRAWELSPAVQKRLTDAFGTTYERTLQTRGVRARENGIHEASELSVGRVKGRDVTMADVLGEPMAGHAYSEGLRVGPYAWSQAAAPADFANGGRGYLLRVQKALNQNMPVWITWWSEGDSIDAEGRYRARGLDDQGTSHASVIVDYQVDAPGFGILPVEVRETRPEALAASLSPDAVVRFFRVKDPWWGSYMPDDRVGPFAGAPGYHDIDIDYLRQRLPQYGTTALFSLVLPNDEALTLEGK